MSSRYNLLALVALLILSVKMCAAAPATLTYEQVIIKHHNVHRANHSSPDLNWGTIQARNAKTWAQQCNFAHNTSIGDANYGQNLMAGVPKNQVSRAVSDWWYNSEMPYFKWYGQANPDFSTFGSYGHFSQVVWSNTLRVGCYTQDCSAKGLKGVGSNVPPYLTVCNYYPAGNYGGQWAQNVKKPKGNPTVTSQTKL